jgi:hypothetical protein
VRAALLEAAYERRIADSQRLRLTR